MKLSMLVSAAAVLALATGSTIAAPCNTGSAKGKTSEQHASSDHNMKSSAADTGAKNLAGGQQPASPGTVGAMNNVGANQGLGEKPGSEDKINQGDGVGTSSKNLAGGQQPAYPGTVGALNNAGANQKLGDQTQKDDGC
ncbi:exopolysaccharide production protein YjbE [Methylorubrum extorquens]|uniref:exopolysaccharide production protein YjbE n=1 Tax=Methylorubrum extorquens TaxID=408 RepID=UPI00097294BD|nr:exopolysaccharide production protein YjbE [Methylorubrum extorquens]APX85942.1 exopolysaccharide production protein YjbE [Methylorubrum extorquens]